MSPEAQRLAIAEACGWTDCKPGQNGVLFGRYPDADLILVVPFYCNDLNAIVSAVKGLSPDQEIAYVSALHDVVFGYPNSYDDEPSIWHSDIFRLSHSTAAQRAEAFLRTLGLWKESPCADGTCGKYRTFAGGCPVCGDPCL